MRELLTTMSKKVVDVPDVSSRRFMQPLGEGTALSSLGCCGVGMMNVIIQTASGQRVNWQRGIREGKTFLS